MHFDLEPSYLCEYDYVKVITKHSIILGVHSHSNCLSDGQRRLSQNHSCETKSSKLGRLPDVDECKERNDEELACDHYCHNYIGGYYCSCRFGYLLHSDNRTCRVECSDNIFIEQSGIITSSDFPNPYPKSSDCLYRIELEEGFIINLEFDDSFDIEDHPEVTCPYDYLKIKAGQNEFGPFCGDQSPGKIEMGSNRVQILFHSDNSGDNGGWKLTYSAVEVDKFQIGCLKDGSWSNNVPICKIVDCKNAPDLQFGSVIYNSLSNLTTYRSTVHYSCQIPRYQMYPAINGTYICGEKGFWINDELGAKLPSCLPAYSSKTIKSTSKIFSFSVDTDKLDPHLCLCLLPVCGQPARQLPGLLKRIVGGRTAEPGFFPWQALIMVEDVSRVPEGKWFGSGALLSDSWVLTAAHVLRSPRRDNTVIPVSEEHVTIYLGLHDVRNKTDAINRTAEKIVLHERFDPKNYNNDIALVKLKKKVKMSQFIMPVCLPTTDQSETEPQPQALGLVAGWGLSNPNVSMDEATSSDFGTVSDVLQYVKLPVVMHTECKTSYESRSGSYNITNNMFCAGYYEGGKDTCLGDSGGAFIMEDPQTKRWVAQGLVSWGGPEECGSQRVYGVYTKVSNYLRWLEDKLTKQ
ncbi:MASP1 protease, partial [Polypterus senegalus]|nr:MASP1 protease [Polypterus senegalus]